MKTAGTVLILGSAPNVVACRDWPKSSFASIVAINNAWQVRDDWDYQIAPDDFPRDRLPKRLRKDQRLIGSDEYVPANNAYGGVVYAGGTMAFSAGYWVLAALRPAAMIFVGCDMVYPKQGNTHFYGSGTADPLRADVTLRNLEAKSARLMLHAARQGCACLRAPVGESRLVFPAVAENELHGQEMTPLAPDPSDFQHAEAYEQKLGYFVKSGRYWIVARGFSVVKLDTVDQRWMDVLRGAKTR